MTIYMRFCGKPIPTRANSKYDPEDLHKCFRERGHDGRCEEFHYLDHLKDAAPKVRQKIIRDATKTTGASWKSTDAGPNRISRWTMLLSDADLKELGIKMAELKPWVQAKLREKAASYKDCMESAQKLAYLAYGMESAPKPPDAIRTYLENLFGQIKEGRTQCIICREPLKFDLFAAARRGKAEIETSHANPRIHAADNVGFAHRNCNIAQGDKTIDDFYDWIHGILERAGKL